MRSQGLPMSFIIIAVMSVLVLVVVAIFFYSGFRTEAVTQQTAVNACNSRCLIEAKYAKEQETQYMRVNSPFCSLVQDVKGMGDGLKCDNLVNCELTRGDGKTCVYRCVINAEKGYCSAPGE